VLTRGVVAVIHDKSRTAAGVVTYSLFYLMYISYTVLFAMSQLRLANTLEIVPERKTDPKSMIFHCG
jgi:hypothetical protein